MNQAVDHQITQFVYESGLSDLLLRCQIRCSFGHLLIQAPSPKIAQDLWHRHGILRDCIQRQKIVATASIVCNPVHYDFCIETGKEGRLGLPTEEQELLREAIHSPSPCVVVRMRDDVIIQANHSMSRCGVASGQWYGFSARRFWHEEPYYLSTLRHFLEKDRIITGFEGTIQTFRMIEGRFQPARKKHVCLDVFRLDEYFGEPVRLSVCRYSS